MPRMDASPCPCCPCECGPPSGGYVRRGGRRRWCSPSSSPNGVLLDCDGEQAQKIATFVVYTEVRNGSPWMGPPPTDNENSILGDGESPHRAGPLDLGW
jgi:hypothetical protein